MLFAMPLLAQDTIVKTNFSVIIARIQEIDNKNITYRKFDNPGGPVYILDKRRVSYIKYSNGIVDTFALNRPTIIKYNAIKKLYANDSSKNILSFVISDPAFGIISFGYERLFNSRKYGIRIPVSISFSTVGIGNKYPKDNYSLNYTYEQWYRKFYYNRYKIISTGVDLYYYPSKGIGRLRYFIGPALEFGQFHYLFQQNNDKAVRKTGTYGGFLFKNGLVYNLNKKFCASLSLAGGLFFQFDNEYNNAFNFVTPDEMLSFEAGLHLGYKF